MDMSSWNSDDYASLEAAISGYFLMDLYGEVDTHTPTA